MLGPKQERYVTRLEELITEGNDVLLEYAKHEDSRFNILPDTVVSNLSRWLVQTENIIGMVFGRTGAHYTRYERITQKYVIEHYQIPHLIGILDAGCSDLRDGFLIGQEFLVAGEVFVSVLDQAKHLLSAGYKDPAAILARVVLEDALKRLARANGLSDNKKAAIINQDLRHAGVYHQHQERLVQSRLDIGNDAAHGDFHKYTEADVTKMIEDIEQFLAFHFAP